MDKPRTGYFYGLKVIHAEGANGTWLEGEEFAYPAGGFTRRARVKMPTGELRIVRCSIPDTYFSIPARVKVKGRTAKGFITCMEGTFEWTFEKGEET
uniref:Uncharacterized protein n=1 Tax=viral metagenome TaxID=1070528 RepID=A0A6H1ZP60_9ZZZZ